MNYLKLLLLGSLLILTSKVLAKDLNFEKCFEQPRRFKRIKGHELLPKSLCFNQISLIKEENYLGTITYFAQFTGDPISGKYLLVDFFETSDVLKWITYLSHESIVVDGNKRDVDLRLSVDTDFSFTSVEIFYVVAELTDHKQDGIKNTKFYYYLPVN